MLNKKLPVQSVRIFLRINEFSTILDFLSVYIITMVLVFILIYNEWTYFLNPDPVFKFVPDADFAAGPKTYPISEQLIQKLLQRQVSTSWRGKDVWSLIACRQNGRIHMSHCENRIQIAPRYWLANILIHTPFKERKYCWQTSQHLLWIVDHTLVYS